MSNATVSLKNCFFNRERKSLVVSSDLTRGFPAEVNVRSHFTDRVVRFVPDHEAAERYEFWDGEEMWYRPTEEIKNVDCLVVSNMIE